MILYKVPINKTRLKGTKELLEKLQKYMKTEPSLKFYTRDQVTKQKEEVSEVIMLLTTKKRTEGTGYKILIKIKRNSKRNKKIQLKILNSDKSRRDLQLVKRIESRYVPT